MPYTGVGYADVCYRSGRFGQFGRLAKELG
jgi:hypothetical protein